MSKKKFEQRPTICSKKKSSSLLMFQFCSTFSLSDLHINLVLSAFTSRQISGLSYYIQPLVLLPFILHLSALTQPPLPFNTTSYFDLFHFRSNAPSLNYVHQFTPFCLMGISFLDLHPLNNEHN